MSSFATVSAVVGGLASMGLVGLVQTLFFVRSATRTRATVVRRVDASVHGHDTSTSPASTERWIVELVSKGRVRRVPLAEAFGGAIAERLIADDGSIPVLFDPREPERVRIDSPWTLYFMPAFLCAPGILWLALVGYVAIAR